MNGKKPSKKGQKVDLLIDKTPFLMLEMLIVKMYNSIFFFCTFQFLDYKVSEHLP